MTGYQAYRYTVLGNDIKDTSLEICNRDYTDDEWDELSLSEIREYAYESKIKEGKQKIKRLLGDTIDSYCIDFSNDSEELLSIIKLKYKSYIKNLKAQIQNQFIICNDLIDTPEKLVTPNQAIHVKTMLQTIKEKLHQYTPDKKFIDDFFINKGFLEMCNLKVQYSHSYIRGINNRLGGELGNYHINCYYLLDYKNITIYNNIIDELFSELKAQYVTNDELLEPLDEKYLYYVKDELKKVLQSSRTILQDAKQEILTKDVQWRTLQDVWGNSANRDEMPYTPFCLQKLSILFSQHYIESTKKYNEIITTTIESVILEDLSNQ